jgi:hypothetical protein
LLLAGYLLGLLFSLKIEAVCFFETYVNFYWTKQHHIPQNSTLHGHCCENLKSSIFILFFAIYISNYININLILVEKWLTQQVKSQYRGTAVLNSKEIHACI